MALSSSNIRRLTLHTTIITYYSVAKWPSIWIIYFGELLDFCCCNFSELWALLWTTSRRIVLCNDALEEFSIVRRPERKHTQQLKRYPLCSRVRWNVGSHTSYNYIQHLQRIKNSEKKFALILHFYCFWRKTHGVSWVPSTVLLHKFRLLVCLCADQFYVSNG